MRRPILFLVTTLAFAGLFSSCAPAVKVSLSGKPSSTLSATSENVLVLEKGQPRPANAETIGSVKISDSGFSINCSYLKVIERAKQEARNAGGNALQIQEHLTPDRRSTCHRIEALILYIPGYQNISEHQPVKPSSIRNPELEKIKTIRKAYYDSLVAANPDTSKFVFIEQQPEFPGGINAMNQFLSSAIKYPKTAISDNISGLVVGPFVVDTNGEITDAKILKSVREDIDQEFIRIIMAMPAWVPAFQNGKPVNVRFTLPFRFSCGKTVKKS